MNIPPLSTSNGTRYTATLEDWPRRTGQDIFGGDEVWEMPAFPSPARRIIGAAFGFGLCIVAICAAAIALVLDHLLNHGDNK